MGNWINNEGYFKTSVDNNKQPVYASNPGIVGWTNAGLQSLTSAVDSYNSIDSSPIENQIDNASKNTIFNASDNIGLLNQWTNYNPLDTDYSISDMGFNWGEQIGNTFNSTLSGLSTGNIWGGVAGLAIGLAGNVAAGIKANNAVKSAEKEAKKVNYLNQNKFLKQVDNIDQQNDLLMKRNSFAEGGTMNLPEGLSFINEGGTHEQNPLGGVPMGIAEDGSQNLVEEGEVIYNDYVFSNRLKVPQELKDKYKIKDKVITFADAVKELIKPYENNMEDPINKRGIEAIMQDFTLVQEELRMRKQIKNKQKTNKTVFDEGGWKKYAPIGANILGLTQNIFTPQDYEYANKIETAAKKLPSIKPTLISGKIPFTPYDTNYLLGKQIAASNASRQGMFNTAGNAGAARAIALASDNALINALGETYFKGLESNEAKRLQALQYNLGIDQYNAQAIDKANIANAELEKAYQDAYLRNLTTAASLRREEDSSRAAAIGANTKALAENLYQLYKDDWYREKVNKAIENGDYGALQHVGTQSGAFGGPIKRKNKKRKKGLTY